MTIPDSTFFSALASVIASLAGAGAWMTKRHLANLSKTVKMQARHITICENDRGEMKREYSNIKDRTRVLEYTLGVTEQCPKTDCPNKNLMEATSRIVVRAT
tara:strand:+ start:468 stop:773 length:306 start_codon:yes stop_codon:yes gene_type:complete